MKRLIFVITVLVSIPLFIACPSAPKPDLPAPAQGAQSVPQAAAVSVPGSGDNYAARTKRPSDAAKAPDFSIKDLDGNVISLSQNKGKVVILDFWATWCPPCRAEIPDFISLNTMYSKKDFMMLGAAVDDPTKVKNFITRMSMNYAVFIADQDLQNSFGGIRGIPTTFVIDKEGYIVRQYVGYRPKATFEQDIKDLL